MKKLKFIILLSSLALLSKIKSADQQCGNQAGNALCSNGLCCSQYGWCGSTDDYCKNGCQSQCGGATPNPTPNPTPTPSTGGDVGSVISSSLFDRMLKYRNDQGCPGHGFYRYNAFLNAASSFNGFGTTGDVDTCKREIAAFFGQTSHETYGGWPSAPDGPFAWGYCFVREPNNSNRYAGRGPIQLTHDYNYYLAGKGIGVDLVNNPDLVATDATISFKTAIWFWMTPHGNKPSSHDVIVRKWRPSGADTSAGRIAGYGVITNIFNGGVECGKGSDERVDNRIGFFTRYCDMFEIGNGSNLDCYNQRPF